MSSHWSLSDIKFLQVSRTLLSILVYRNNAVVWMVFSRPPVLVPILWGLYQSAPITIGIIIISCFTDFQFPSNVLVLIFLFAFFQFSSVVSRDRKIYYSQVLFFVLIFTKSCRLVEIW